MVHSPPDKSTDNRACHRVASEYVDEREPYQRVLSLGNHGCVLWFKPASLSESNLHLCPPLGTITLYSGVGEGRSGKNVRSPLFPFTAALSLSLVS